MPVARNAGPWRHLLGSKRKVVRASARINFEDDLAAGVRQAFPIVRTKKVTPRFHVLGVGALTLQAMAQLPTGAGLRVREYV
jgi:hypothetical protein